MVHALHIKHNKALQWRECTHEQVARDCKLTNRGRGGAADVSEVALLQAGWAAQLAHGGFKARLDVRPGAHVFGLLLAPHQLRAPVLRHDLHAPDHPSTSSFPQSLQAHYVEASRGAFDVLDVDSDDMRRKLALMSRSEGNGAICSRRTSTMSRMRRALRAPDRW